MNEPRRSKENSSSIPARAFLPLAGLAALALTVSNEPPQGALATRIIAATANASAETIGKAVGKAIGSAGIALVVLVAVVLIAGMLEAVIHKKRFMLKSQSGSRPVNPFMQIAAYLLAAAMVFGFFFGIWHLLEGDAGPAEAVGRAAPEPAEPEPEPGLMPSVVSRDDGVPVPEPADSAFARLVLGALALGVVALLAAAAYRRLAAASAQPSAPPAVDVDLAVGLARARERLHSGDAVRDAIIDCYADMCGLFSERDTPRAWALTAREFAALLRNRGAGENQISILTALFEKARYSGDPCGPEDRDSASDAMQALERMYGQPAPEADA